MADVKLYYSPGSCSLAPHILLREAGVAADTIELSVKQGYPAEQRALNPKLRVPILILNGQTITETPAILTAIAQLAPPEAHLLGQSDLDRVRVLEYMSYLSSTVHTQAWGQILRPARFSDDESAHAGIRAKGLKNAIESLDYLEGTLKAAAAGSSGSVHAVGGKFTAIDVYLYVFYRWSSREGIDMPARYPKYTSLVAGLLKRKSVQEALEIEGVDSYAPKLQ